MAYFEDSFNNSIDDILDIMSHDAFWIHLYQDVKCTCIDHTSQNPDPKCKKCLGTGCKIKIVKVQTTTDDVDNKAMLTLGERIVMHKIFYLKADWELSLNDLIVEDGDVYYVFQKIEGHSFHEHHVFNKYICPHKKLDSQIFLKNFNEIVGE